MPKKLLAALSGNRLFLSQKTVFFVSPLIIFCIYAEEITMPNRLYQSVVHQMKDAIDRPFGVIDENGIIAACNDPKRIGEPCGPTKEEMVYTDGQAVFGGNTYHQITVAGRCSCVAFVQGDDEFAARMAAVLAF